MHQQRTHALEEELDTHLKHREHILLKNYTPGLETATDSKMVGSLMELIRDKNARIEVLEQVSIIVNVAHAGSLETDRSAVFREHQQEYFRGGVR